MIDTQNGDEDEDNPDDAEIEEDQLNLFFDPNLETEIEPQLFGEESLYFSRAFFERRKTLCSRYVTDMYARIKAKKAERRAKRKEQIRIDRL